MRSPVQTRYEDLPQDVRRLIGAYEGLRGYHMLPEADGGASLERRLTEVSGLAQAAALSQVPLLPEELRAQISHVTGLDRRERRFGRIHEIANRRLGVAQLRLHGRILCHLDAMVDG